MQVDVFEMETTVYDRKLSYKTKLNSVKLKSVTLKSKSKNPSSRAIIGLLCGMNVRLHNDGGYDRTYAVRGILRVMKILGLWKWQTEADKETPRHILWLQYVQRLVCHGPFTFVFITLMWIEALRANGLDEMGDVLYMSLTEAALIVKILNIWQHSTKASTFLHALRHNAHFALHSGDEVTFWRNAQKKFRYIIYMYSAGSVFTVISAFAGVLFVTEPQMAFAYWVPFEWQSNRRNYWLAYLYDFVSMVCTAGSNVCLDMMGCYMMFHVSLLYKVLSFRLQKLRAVKGEDVNEKFKKLILMHKSIRRMTRECEILSSKYVLSQIILSALILCFCCYRIIKLDIVANFGQFLSMLQFLAVMIFEIFLPCYFGNEITLNSSEIMLDVYRTDWLEYSVANRKLIILFREFLKRPDKVTIGGYFEVGLPIFTKVVNNAYSFFALLMNVEK
ncbi:odorant receptor 94b-like [Musca domestica]|uniref:Odorant receptor n=1 Tax=Musca domestica TaxID=7370 RepID=A0A9J7DIE4_MUSDO|nr:odorant receptor 94b-like [Musca domestica]